MGNLGAILRTRGEMQVRFAPQSTLPMACQISRNLYQYFGASCDIGPLSKPVSDTSNVISVLQGPPKNNWATIGHPIVIGSTGVEVEGPSSCIPPKKLYPSEPGLGAIFLVGRSEEKLELRVWGYDTDGLQQALRLIPTLTGVGQPDFVIVRKECAWKGAAGVSAMGFFDSRWKVSNGSYLS